MRVTKYRPAFFSGYPDEVYEVSSKEELLASKLCVNISSLKSFSRFSFRACGGYGILSAHFENGEHYIVATVNKEDVNTLDNWFNSTESPRIVECNQ